MRQKKIGVRKLARQCGIDASFISKVILGQRNPPCDEQIIKKISEALSIDPIMLTIYTGRIPASLQPLLEEPAFVESIKLKKPYREHVKTPPPRSSTPDSVPAVKTRRQPVVSRHDIADELL